MAIKPPSEEWLNQVREPIIDPGRNIVDPHHHLWRSPAWTYALDDLWADTGSGHKVTKTVFLECRASYHQGGPEHLKPVGETAFVESIASASREGPGSEIAGIVAHTDLTSPHLDEVLDAHEEAANGLFRGIRHSIARDPHPESLSIPGRGSEGLSTNDAFRNGLERLGERGLSYDSWLYHHQILDFKALANSAPGTTVVLDHFATPLGVGPYTDQREEIFLRWCEDIAALAECPNVVAKLGGLAMPDNGFGWEKRDLPPSSDEFVEAQARYYHHTINCFGANRCMFESNFPVDRLSLSYHVLWNGLKKIAAQYTEEEQIALFSSTATRIYKLD
ncbi:MAG: amidohydrolase family protein [Verrucomicrobia bacterium]|nr:amidohydrolase family protein [Verrucomicrobiota bacterium]